MIHFGSKYEGNYNKSIVGKVELINTRTYTGTENVFEISDGSNVSVQGIDTGEYELDLYIKKINGDVRFIRVRVSIVLVLIETSF